MKHMGFKKKITKKITLHDVPEDKKFYTLESFSFYQNNKSQVLNEKHNFR